MNRSRFVLLSVLAIVAAAVAGRTAAAGTASHNFVYTETNSATGNAIAVYATTAGGSLVPQGTVPTGGLGTGAALASQGSVLVSGSQLYAVNAGDNTISAFKLGPGGLTLEGSPVSSGGTDPISLTAHGRFLYVLNAGSLTISGFSTGGGLSPLPNSTQPLSSGAAGPEQIGFSQDGRALVVTEKVSNTIDTFAVGPGGLAGAAQSNPSAGSGPYGFGFDNQGDLLVTDAVTGAVTSYTVSDSGSLSLLDGPVSTNGQAAPCWLVTAGGGRYAYSADTGSGTISGFSVHDGRLALLDSSGVSATSGSSPFDLAVSRDGHFLYNLASGSHELAAFGLGSDGGLTPAGTVTGLPASDAGLATG